MAVELDHKSLAKLQKLGVKVVTDVDRESFIRIAEPLQEQIAKGLGPHAEKDPADLPDDPIRWRSLPPIAPGWCWRRIAT